MKTYAWKDLKAAKLPKETLERIRREADQGDPRAQPLRHPRARRQELQGWRSRRSRRRSGGTITCSRRRYVEACGGELELTAVINGKRVRLVGV